ncbi:flagellar biosynthesis protein FliQ [Polymorphobacter sp. PAMC 29334]|uniref:flagellar biosynthesis protein FliQ n=1 Tax=Polymorphobacter sp. PAMC 29334 TaxID=2862331 RepID=UPI001C755070|nr:flagellar biosynthesis protein FliQ [Polymorphobacter sp. PAMC 29334]QYE34423.1 flagellar biosynthesis protein FliQ [Polymorphobacter sp. PAMC 29334]
MDSGIVMDALRGTMWVLAQLVAPVVLPALIAGFVVGLLQAATGISESTLSFVPKLIVTLATLAILGSMMMRELSDFTVELYDRIPALLR